LIESRSTGGGEEPPGEQQRGWLSEEEKHTPLERYVIVGHASKGLELPHICCWDSGEEVLPVFSSEEAAQEFLSSSSSLGKGWYVRGFSGGELVSMLFAFHRRIKGALLDPPAGAISAAEVVGSSSLVRWDALVSLLLETSSYHPRAVGSRSSS
jgi:hypothetical protein